MPNVRRRLSLSTRLLLPLLATVVLIMSLYGRWELAERERTLEAQTRRATHAYATALELAIDGPFLSGNRLGVQEIVDRISREPEIYGVLVYGGQGEVLFASDLLRGAGSPLEAVQRSVSSNSPVTFERMVGETSVFTVLRPLRSQTGTVLGALEVAQPLSFVEAQKEQTRNAFLLNTITLLITLSALILWLVRRMIGQPLGGLVSAARALGRGDFTHRIDTETGAGELTELAIEFNGMADKVEHARNEILRETQERLHLEQQLRQTEKMAAVGKLAASLAHEIAAPLNVVAGRAEMLRKKGGAPHQEKNLQIIIDQIGRITVIVKNLLDFARRREPRMTEHNLSAVLFNVLDFLESEFDRAGVDIRTEIPQTLDVVGDPNLLHQVLLNLLLNSVQALDGTVGEKVIWISARGGEGATPVTIEIKDSGPGISQEHLGQIFEPFFTTKGDGGGTGLGLAVSLGIVEEHGGEITAGNWSGGGFFCVSLRGRDMAAHA